MDKGREDNQLISYENANVRENVKEIQETN